MNISVSNSFIVVSFSKISVSVPFLTAKIIPTKFPFPIPLSTVTPVPSSLTSYFNFKSIVNFDKEISSLSSLTIFLIIIQIIPAATNTKSIKIREVIIDDKPFLFLFFPI